MTSTEEQKTERSHPLEPPQKIGDCLACRVTGTVSLSALGAYLLYERSLLQVGHKNRVFLAAAGAGIVNRMSVHRPLTKHSVVDDARFLRPRDLPGTDVTPARASVA